MLRIKDSDEVGKMENSTKGKKKKKPHIKAYVHKVIVSLTFIGIRPVLATPLHFPFLQLVVETTL